MQERSEPSQPGARTQDLANPFKATHSHCLSRKRVADWPLLPWASRVAEAIWRLPEVHKVPSYVARGSEIHGSSARAA